MAFVLFMYDSNRRNDEGHFRRNFFCSLKLIPIALTVPITEKRPSRQNLLITMENRSCIIPPVLPICGYGRHFHFIRATCSCVCAGIRLKKEDLGQCANDSDPHEVMTNGVDAM